MVIWQRGTLLVPSAGSYGYLAGRDFARASCWFIWTFGREGLCSCHPLVHMDIWQGGTLLVPAAETRGLGFCGFAQKTRLL